MVAAVPTKAMAAVADLSVVNCYNDDKQRLFVEDIVRIVSELDSPSADDCHRKSGGVRLSASDDVRGESAVHSVEAKRRTMNLVGAGGSSGSSIDEYDKDDVKDDVKDDTAFSAASSLCGLSVVIHFVAMVCRFSDVEMAGLDTVEKRARSVSMIVDIMKKSGYHCDTTACTIVTDCIEMVFAIRKGVASISAAGGITNTAAIAAAALASAVSSAGPVAVVATATAGTAALVLCCYCCCYRRSRGDETGV